MPNPDLKAAVERLNKLAVSTIVDATDLNALGQFPGATYGDLRLVLSAFTQPPTWRDVEAPNLAALHTQAMEALRRLADAEDMNEAMYEAAIGEGPGLNAQEARRKSVYAALAALEGPSTDEH